MANRDIKAIEFILALYSIAVGVLFMTNPSALLSPVYDGFAELGPTYWGVQLVLVGVLHLSAVALNGNAPIISTATRAFACAAHFYISCRFVVMFLAGGAPWGGFTFGWLVPGIVFLISRRVFLQFMQLRDAKNA